MSIFFDVLDTLLTEDEVPRPHARTRAREAFLMFMESGHGPYLWSSGGAGYAAAAGLLGVADLFSGCFGKRREPGVPVDFVVDDRSMVEERGGYRITPFGGDPGDEELSGAAEAVGYQGPRSAVGGECRG